MASPSYGRNYPSTAYILALIGAIFIVLEGIAELALASAGAALVASFGYGGLAAIILALGVALLLVGIVVLYGSLQLRSHPESAHTWGVLILVLAVVSLVGGGGFFIGFILALVGGILALTWKPPAPAPMGGYGQPMSPGAPAWGPPAPPPPMSPTPPVAGQKYCSFCGAPNIANAQFCAKCGARLQ